MMNEISGVVEGKGIEAKGRNIGAPKCVKIIVTDRHDVRRVKRILNSFRPEFFILESQSRLSNLKTLYIAQTLRVGGGCRDVKMKFYKGGLLKVLFSRTPRRSCDGVGDLMPDIDSSREDEIREETRAQHREIVK